MYMVPKPEYNGTTFRDVIEYLPKSWSALDECNSNVKGIRDYVNRAKQEEAP
jgi:hypothetical protein